MNNDWLGNSSSSSGLGSLGNSGKQPGWGSPAGGSEKSGLGSAWGSGKRDSFGSDCGNKGQSIWRPLSASKPGRPRNFWGDIDGDGKETAWDDVLGDGLLESAMAAVERERRGEPPEPEDEFLIGRRYTPLAASGANSTGTGASTTAIVLLVVGAAVGLCAILTGLMR